MNGADWRVHHDHGLCYDRQRSFKTGKRDKQEDREIGSQCDSPFERKKHQHRHQQGKTRTTTTAGAHTANTTSDRRERRRQRRAT